MINYIILKKESYNKSYDFSLPTFLALFSARSGPLSPFPVILLSPKPSPLIAGNEISSAEPDNF
jgi:hypothetical protein